MSDMTQFCKVRALALQQANGVVQMGDEENAPFVEVPKPADTPVLHWNLVVQRGARLPDERVNVSFSQLNERAPGAAQTARTAERL